MRAMPSSPCWVVRYDPTQPLPHWLRWHPFVAWARNEKEVVSLSLMFANGIFLNPEPGDYIVRNPTGEVSLLTPPMYERLFSTVEEDDNATDYPTQTIHLARSADWRTFAAEGHGAT